VEVAVGTRSKFENFYCFSPVQFSIRCWQSQAQTFLVSDAFGTHDLNYVCSKTVFVFGNEVSLIRGGVCLYE
jgi:hypothetical protein